MEQSAWTVEMCINVTLVCPTSNNQRNYREHIYTNNREMVHRSSDLLYIPILAVCENSTVQSWSSQMTGSQIPNPCMKQQEI